MSGYAGTQTASIEETMHELGQLDTNPPKMKKMEFILITDKSEQFIEIKEFPDVPLFGWPLLNLEHICKTFLHNPYLQHNEHVPGTPFSIGFRKHNIVRVFCRISDESLPQNSPGIPADPNP